MLEQDILIDKTHKKQIQYLVCRKFPHINFNNLGKPKIKQHPNDVKAEELCKLYLDELTKKSEDEIKQLYAQEKDLEKQEIDNQLQKEEKRFIHQYGASYECFSYFSKFNTLSIFELLALILGLDPRLISLEIMQHYTNRSIPTVKKHLEYMELIKRKFKDQFIIRGHSAFITNTYWTETQINVVEFFTWANSINISIEPKFIKSLQDIGTHRVSIEFMENTIKAVSMELAQLRQHLLDANTTIEAKDKRKRQLNHLVN
jgi:hypothetical protein